MRNEPGGWQVCSRGVELWDKTQSRKLGWFDTEAEWTWNPTAIRESGLIHPDEFKANEQDQGADDVAQALPDADTVTRR